MKRTRSTSTTSRGGQNNDPADKILFLEVINKPEHKTILNNMKTTKYVNRQKLRTWLKIAHEFNAGARIKKTVEQLKSMYHNNKLQTILMASNPTVQTRLQSDDDNSQGLTGDNKQDEDKKGKINRKFHMDIELAQSSQLKPVTAVDEAKIKMFESIAKAAEAKSNRLQNLFAKKIELINQKILYYQEKRERDTEQHWDLDSYY